MPAGRAHSGWTSAGRIGWILAACVGFSVYAAAVAAPLESTGSLTPPPEPGLELLAYPRPPATPAKAVPATGIGLAHPVSAATARLVHQVRTAYLSPPEQSVPIRPRPPAPPPPPEPPPPEPPVWTSLPALTLIDDPASPFRMELDRSRKTVTVTVEDAPDISFEIDYRDRAGDIHRVGITPILGERRFEGTFHRALGELTFPLVTPTFDAGRVSYTTISNEGGELWVRFESGPYANLRPRPEADGFTYLEARITLPEDRVRMDLEGLYYLRPAVGSELRFAHDERESTSLTVAADTRRFLTNVDSPTKVRITDPLYGPYWLGTDVTRLQVQWDGVGTSFELDFDHAFKDLGQVSVNSRLVFLKPGAIG